jgi:hypothetical protein
MTIPNNKKQKKVRFSKKQIDFFEKEVRNAKGFDELMIKKSALEPRNNAYAILTYENITEYKKKYLTGVYKSLRPRFRTKVPYSFWSQLYMALKRKMIISK